MASEYKLPYTGAEIAQKLQKIEDMATEAYVDNAIGSIPTPDVSGQIGAHNTSVDSHTDIRSSIEELTRTVDGIVVPTKISELTNDIGYLTSAPVTSVNGKTGDVALVASDVGADSSGTASGLVSTHNAATDAHNDIRLLIDGLTARLNTLLDSDDTTLDQLSELVAYIKDNRELIESVTTSKVSVTDIVDNLETNVVDKPLSAAQGVILKALYDALLVGKLDTSKLQEAIDAALAQAKASGEFDGEDGQNGTSVTVTSITESGEDGGSNVVKFSDGKTLNVKNGKTGAVGPQGPQGPAYTLTDADKNTIAAAVKASLATETFKFTLEDGSVVTKEVFVK